MKKTNRVKLLIFVPLLLVAFLSLFPFLWMLGNSFSSAKELFKIPPNLIPNLLFTAEIFANYKTVLGQFNFQRYIANTVLVAGTAAIGQVLTCSLAGFAFARMQFWGKNLIFITLIITLMVPVHATIIPEYFLMLKLRWFDSYAPLIVPSLLVGSFGAFLFKEFFENIPTALIDAGAIDACNSFKLFFKICLPQSHAPIATLLIIAFMNNWNDLLRPILYISKDELKLVTQGLASFKSQYEANWNLLLAASVLSILPLIILFIFLQRFFVADGISSGTKG